MGAREYDPSLGRWLSADTIVPDPANPQSLNRYAYVYNNPCKYTDPSGHDACAFLGALHWTLGAICSGSVKVIGTHAAFYGKGPDRRGLRTVERNKQAIEAGVGEIEGAELIYTAAGIAVQNQWWLGLSEDIAAGAYRGENPSRGPAQIRDSEMEGISGDQFFMKPAAHAMAAKIQRSIDACDGCSPTDIAIVAAIAQNGFGPGSVDDVQKTYGRSDGFVDWGSYFADLPPSSVSFASDPRRDLFVERTGDMPWNQYQLLMFTNDLQALVNSGWDLPAGVDLDYMRRIASGEAD